LRLFLSFPRFHFGTKKKGKISGITAFNGPPNGFASHKNRYPHHKNNINICRKTLVHKITNVPVVSTYFGPKWILASLVAIQGPKYINFQGPPFPIPSK
jgi:hypothetical protein